MKENTYFKKVAAIRNQATKAATTRMPNTLPKQLRTTVPKVNSISIDTKSKLNSDGEIINPTPQDVAKYNQKYTTIKMPKKRLTNTVKKVITAPARLVKKQWNKNQAFRNKNSTKAKFEQNSK